MQNINELGGMMSRQQDVRIPGWRGLLSMLGSAALVAVLPRARPTFRFALESGGMTMRAGMILWRLFLHGKDHKDFLMRDLPQRSGQDLHQAR